MTQWKGTFCVTRFKILDRIWESSRRGITGSQKFPEKMEKILGKEDYIEVDRKT